MWGTQSPCTALGGREIEQWLRTVWQGLLQLNREPPQDPAVQSQVHNKGHADTSTQTPGHMSTAARFITDRMEMVQTCIDRRMDKQHVVYPSVEYYSAIKRNKALTHATAWMNHKTLFSVKKVRRKRPHVI